MDTGVAVLLRTVCTGYFNFYFDFNASTTNYDAIRT